MVSTIQSHLAQAIGTGDLASDPREFYSEEDEQIMRAAAGEHGFESLGRLREMLGGRFDYPTLNYFRAFEQRAAGRLEPRAAK